MLVAALTALLAPAAAANASVTLGSDLSPAPEGDLICTCTLSQTGLPEGGQLTSPVNGTVVRWRAVKNDPAPNGTLTAGIRVVRPLGAGRLFLSGAATSTIPGDGSAVPAALPISAGDQLALDLSAGRLGTSSGGGYDRWSPQPDPGPAPPPSAATGELHFNADVEPTNAFTVTTPIVDRKQGSALVDVSLPNLGNVQATSTPVRVGAARKAKRRAQGAKKRRRPLIEAFEATSVGPGTVTLKLEPSKPVHRTLLAKGRASGQVSITYTPAYGSPSTQSVALKLRLRAKRSAG